MSEEMLQAALLGIEQEVTLDDLLKEPERGQWLEVSRGLLQAPVALLDATGQAVAGEQDPDAARVPLVLELEPVGYLAAACERERLQALQQFWQWNLKQRLKYRMASDMHTRIVHDDYHELQARNQELAASEARYRELAEQLEIRVREQVRTINAAQRQLYEQERLASIGHLAAGVAHEINNPVGFINSNLHTAQEYVASLRAHLQPAEQGGKRVSAQELAYIFEDFDDLFSESLDGCARVKKIVQSLKDFSNVDGCEMQRCSVNTLLENVHELFRNRLPEGVEVHLKLAEVTPLELNPGHFGQVFFNLMSNALDALKGQQERAGRISLASEQLADSVRVRISDNGPGMPPEVVKQAFVPFYTTKSVGSGTGLGLTVCRDIVQAHGGTIQVKSRPGVGTQILISLPCRQPVSSEEQ